MIDCQALLIIPMIYIYIYKHYIVWGGVPLPAMGSIEGGILLLL